MSFTLIQMRKLKVQSHLGFDIVITESGFKLLEINTHQELHRYPEYNNDVKEFLKKKYISQQK